MAEAEGVLMEDQSGIIPLTATVKLPPFPVHALPKSIADAVHALSEATQTDPAMAGASALSALAACTGGHAVIEIQAWLARTPEPVLRDDRLAR